MIPVSDLRKWNLISTEYGILPISSIVFNQVHVIGKDGRILWAKEVEGVEISEELLIKFGFEKIKAHDNFYWFVLNINDDYLLPFLHFHPKDKFVSLLAPESEAEITKIEYVHELQNIYYWLKREELQININ